MRRSQDIDVRQQSSVVRSRFSQTLFWEAVLIAGAIVAVDQLTKRIMLATLERGNCSVDGACIDVVWTLRLNLVFNPGASFSTGQSFGPVIGAVSFVMAALMIVLAARTEANLQRRIFAFIAGGALGNGLDRLLRADDGFLSGEVIDFIDFQWWPVFNVADIAIVCSVCLAIVLSFFSNETDDGQIGDA
ncbi:MAG: signal peptidase II [Acidimicrobiales bacterium]|nr:signal peptidase II [Acidimicrobiales bacterium]